MKALYLYPKKESLQLLKNIRGACEVYVLDCDQPLTAIYICFNKTTLRVDVLYDDVIFKFECFGLDFHEIRSFLPDERYKKICDINSRNIRAYARSEWERPFLQGEENFYNSQTLIEAGKKSNVPVSAIAMCSSLVGIVFFDDFQNPILLIAHDVNGTVEMIISQNYQEIVSYIKDHDEFFLET